MLKPNRFYARPIRHAFSGVVGAVLLAGCVHTMQPLTGPEEELHVQVNVGDTVRVLTKDSQRRTFRVTSIETDTLVGGEISVPYADIVFLERRTFSAGRTAGMSAAGVVAGVLLVITSEGAVAVLPGGP